MEAILTIIAIIVTLYILYAIYMFPYLICPSKNKLRLCLNLFLNFTIIWWFINLLDSLCVCCKQNNSKKENIIGLKNFKNSDDTISINLEDYHTNTSQVVENIEGSELENIKQRLIERKRRCL